jgi:RNA polymerase sigma factor (sigma-70 family)
MPLSQTRQVLRHVRETVSPGNEACDGQLLESFLIRQDEMAFGMLLRRHGPMVWGVCYRVTGQIPDAEDAFQAVFLTLVQNADRVWPRDRIGAWLHGVAINTARKARRIADRRRSREKQLARFPHPSIEPALPNGDLNPILDEELSRLPEKFRVPVLLCDLEGRSQRDVARELQLPIGTLCHRLASARRVLARRLTRRGVTLAIGAVATLTVPRSLIAVTRRAGMALISGRKLASLVPPEIVALTEGVTVMNSSKSHLAAAIVLALVVGGLGFGARQLPTLAAGENGSPAAGKKSGTSAEPQIDDRTFLRRLSLDLRGVLPTETESNYFVEDQDSTKRRKVAGWMVVDGNGTKAQAQKGDSKNSFADMSDASLSEYGQLQSELDRLKASPSSNAAHLSDLQKALDAYSFVVQTNDPQDPDAKDRAEQLAKEYQRLLERLKKLEEQKKPTEGSSPKDSSKKTPQQPQGTYEGLLKEYYKHLESQKLKKPATLNDLKRVETLLDELNKKLKSAGTGEIPPFNEIPYLKDLFKLSHSSMDAEQLKQIERQIRQAIATLHPQTPKSIDPKQQKQLLEELDRAMESMNRRQGPQLPGQSDSSSQRATERNRSRLLALEGSSPTNDGEYLRRIMLDLTGKLPTNVEMNYFLADKDANKRAKVLDWVVKSNPEAARRWAEKQKTENRRSEVKPVASPAAAPAQFARLLNELLNGSRTDDQILEALTLATLARFPTESERQFVPGFLKAQADRRKAWEQVLTIQLASDEFRSNLDVLKRRPLSRRASATLNEQKK